MATAKLPMSRVLYQAPRQPGPFARLMPRLLFVGEFLSPGRWRLPVLCQDFYTLSYIQEGSARITVGGHPTTGTAGDTLLYSPQTPYQARNLEPFLDYRTLIFRFVTGESTSLPLRFPILARPSVHRMLDLLLKQIASGKTDERFLKGVLLDLLALAFERGDPFENQKQMPCRVAAEAMAQNLNRPFALAAYAEMAELSPSRFSHLFREQMGESPRSHFTALKLRRAKTLLAESGGAVTRVADAMGFSSIHHFTKWFTHQEGESPSHHAKRLAMAAGGLEKIIPHRLAGV